MTLDPLRRAGDSIGTKSSSESKQGGRGTIFTFFGLNRLRFEPTTYQSQAKTSDLAREQVKNTTMLIREELHG